MASTHYRHSQCKAILLIRRLHTVLTLRHVESDVPSSSPQTAKFEARTNKGAVEECYNENLGSFPPSRATTSACEIVLLEAQQEAGYRYMFEKLMQKAAALDHRIEEIGSVVAETHQLLEWCNPNFPSQEEVVTVGRICCDSDARLNDASVLLETKFSIGGGIRTRLRLEALPSFALFPGQIVGLQGTNRTGDYFMATKLYLPPPLPVPKMPLAQLRDYHITASGDSKKPLGIMVAAGPYTLDDSLNFEPLLALLDAVERSRPDLAIFMGPFLDRQHPLTLRGQADRFPDELFADQILAPIMDTLARCPATRIALVPSTDDLITEYMSLPQAPLDLSTLTSAKVGMTNTPLCWPNPVQFRINEVHVALASTDVLMHISQEEIAQSPNVSDRLARLAGHLLEQRSLYPLYPPALGEHVDTEHASALSLYQQPDLMILPSQLRHFCKTIGSGALCINPGRLSRKQAGGTFARITVHPFASELFYTTEASSRLTHKISERTKVEIVRV
ncbi:DNA polymerase alpha/epsilon subunit B-domain-containing protein [Thamnocephalis sphaerospora]|uniref:DNA polymerase alpha subunit B n=1 Tax=Thamnocephalis sphaerospora TaxID=78915 RepID=A0A4P9XPF7_9FUNG|nr:DNA polymerase alpha/epsilon subunit B-domain-containing protein [Thamnocephalis sphaerospora]|eukprot:RKP07885.1 DNA polymerase alpha/epsilon subunit B-domain-containing protein [Thamnocephalis sphaerospora]